MCVLFFHICKIQLQFAYNIPDLSDVTWLWVAFILLFLLWLNYRISWEHENSLLFVSQCGHKRLWQCLLRGWSPAPLHPLLLQKDTTPSYCSTFHYCCKSFLNCFEHVESTFTSSGSVRVFVCIILKFTCFELLKCMLCVCVPAHVHLFCVFK